MHFVLTFIALFATLLIQYQMGLKMKTAGIPKTHIARNEILGWIREGQFDPGAKLPSERQLAKVFGMNHQTVRKSLAELEREGLIVRKPRIGSFIKEVPPAELTKGIALVVPEYMTASIQIPQHPLMNLYIRGLLESVDQRKYSISILSYHPYRLWVDVGEILKIRKIKGVLLHPTVDVNIEDVKKILDSDTKVVLLHQEENLLPLNLSYIRLDEQAPLVQIFEKMVQLGHKDIVVCDYEYASDSFAKKALLDTLYEKYGIGNAKKQTIWIPNKMGKVNFSVLDSVFERNPLPTSIIVADEFCAAYIFRRCYQLRIWIPQDLSIAALADNTPEFHPIGLTASDTITRSVDVIKFAVNVLEKLLTGEEVIEKEIRLKTNVIWKESIGKCKSIFNKEI